MTAETSPVPPQPGIMEIQLYQGGVSHIPGIENAIKLSSNENPFGPSEKARDAVIRAAHNLHRYPSTDHAGLRAAIGEVHGLDPARIICGNGSDEILHLLAQSYAGPGTEVLFTEHGFSVYKIVTLAAGATPVIAPERERTVDIDALIARAGLATRLVFVTNPGNPTSTMVGLPELERLARAVPQALVVIDAAYCEYAEGYDGGAELATRLPNVFMTRTFSKIYGLGGLRIGWGYGAPGVVDVLNRVRGPFNLSQVALAGAEAAMRDQAYVARCREKNTRNRAWLAEALAEKGVPSDTSTANFILARFADPETAQACNGALMAEGIIVRMVGGYGLPHCLRITVGDEISCRRVAEIIGRFMTDRAGQGA